VTAKRSNLIPVGRLAGVFGIKGWLKVKSSTEPETRILDYSPWWLKTRHGVKAMEIDEAQRHNNGLIVHFKGIDDRDQALQLVSVDIAVEMDQLPTLDAGDYYWHQLIGLQVISVYEGREYPFGEVVRILETGANDVLVVRSCLDQEPERERLVPYVPEVYVKQVDLVEGVIRVDWDPEF